MDEKDYCQINEERYAMSRVRQAEKIIFFGYISNLIIVIMGLLQRTVFIMVLDETLLGVNGLYTSILSVLSMAELGIGTALNYSLYKPVANHDYEKIKSYMSLYKKAYLAIAGVIAGLGLILVPFLPYLIKEHSNVSERELMLYYLIFLFNTVSTYFVAYKYSLINAEQKDYIQTNIVTITKIVTVLLQIAILLLTKSFLAFLLIQAAVELVQKIAVSFYFKKLYPYLNDRNVEKLKKEETDTVITKTKALMLHKIGDVARLSTDNIIITYFINVALVGIVDNYNLIITYAGNFINVIFNSVISGFGNLVATESREKQYSIFKVYRFFACWLYGFAAVGFWLLLTPLVGSLWLDESWILGQGILTLILVDFYLKGGRVVLINFKIASGLFEQDRYLPLIQGIVNLVLSIAGVKLIGLAGIYVGTVVSGVMANLIRPVIIYKNSFSKSAWVYFADSCKYIGTILGILVILQPIRNIVLSQITVFTFVLMAGIISVLYNMIFFVIFRRTEEFGYLWGLVKKKVPGLRRG